MKVSVITIALLLLPVIAFCKGGHSHYHHKIGERFTYSSYRMLLLGTTNIWVPYYAIGTFKYFGYNKHRGIAIVKKDTFAGKMILSNDIVYIYDSSRHKLYLAAVRDTNFTNIVFDSRTGEVVMTKVNALHHDFSWYRELHNGKLSMYDARSNFKYLPHSPMFDKILARHNDEIIPLNTAFLHTVSRKRLVSLMNETYGLQLHPHQYTTHKLLVMLNKMG
jgi:hypothetical protein